MAALHRIVVAEVRNAWQWIETSISTFMAEKGRPNWKSVSTGHRSKEVVMVEDGRSACVVALSSPVPVM